MRCDPIVGRGHPWDGAGQRFSTSPARKFLHGRSGSDMTVGRGVAPLPTSTYSAPGGLRQGPGAVAQSLAEPATAMELPLIASAFDLPDRLASKADPTLIADDERQFAAIGESLRRSIAELSDRLELERRSPAGIGQKALDRDQEVHRLTGRLRALRRFGLDLCLGRMVPDDGSEPVYIGR